MFWAEDSLNTTRELTEPATSFYYSRACASLSTQVNSPKLGDAPLQEHDDARHPGRSRRGPPRLLQPHLRRRRRLGCSRPSAAKSFDPARTTSVHTSVPGEEQPARCSAATDVLIARVS